jgi:hypothetical protein
MGVGCWDIGASYRARTRPFMLGDRPEALNSSLLSQIDLALAPSAPPAKRVRAWAKAAFSALLAQHPLSTPNRCSPGGRTPPSPQDGHAGRHAGACRSGGLLPRSFHRTNATRMKRFSRQTSLRASQRPSACPRAGRHIAAARRRRLVRMKPPVGEPASECFSRDLNFTQE